MGGNLPWAFFLIQPDSSWPFICPSTIQILRTAVDGCRLDCYSPARVDFLWSHELFYLIDISTTIDVLAISTTTVSFDGMMHGGLLSCSRHSPWSDDASDLEHPPSSTDAGRGGAAGSPLRSQHSPNLYL